MIEEMPKNVDDERTSLVVKYRPLSLDELHISPVFAECIRSLINIQNLMILCVGDVCSGKTTVLNSIIFEYYKDSLGFTPEILSINILGDNGIGFYRNEIKAFCKSRSIIPGKKKLVILDNIDAINEQSQHVFRSHIDKFSNNVNFLATCTNPQKVIESIRSRLHVMHINTPDRIYITSLISRIVREEDLDIDLTAQTAILDMCNYSICAVINYLDKVKILGTSIAKVQPVRDNAEHLRTELDSLNQRESANSGTIGADAIYKEIMSDITLSEFTEYFHLVKSRKLKDAIQVLYGIYDNGYSVIDILENMFSFIKTKDIQRVVHCESALTEDDKYVVVELLCKYITIFNTSHEDPVELAILTNNMIREIVGE